MSVIYSRPRIRLPKFFIIKNKRNIKHKKLFNIFFILFIFILIFGVVVKAVTPTFNKLCSDRAKSLATIITNDETTNAIIDYKYSDFIVIHKKINRPKTIHQIIKLKEVI